MNYYAPVEANDLVADWPRIQPFIEMALEHNQEKLTPADILQGLTEGRMHLLQAVDDQDQLRVVVVTEIVQYIKIKALNVLLLAGTDSEDWDDEINALVERWAQICKVDRIECLGRKGMERALKPYGFSRAYIMMVKPVDSVH